jgi:hypothetical protein
MTLADLDGGGQLDLVVSHDDSDRLSIWLGDGKGGFRAAPAVESGSGAWRVAAADFDGDGQADLLAFGSEDGTVTVWLQR